MRNQLDLKLRNILKSIGSDQKKYLIWITGEFGSGKSFWADYLSYFLGKSGIRSSVIHIDDFLQDRTKRNKNSKIYKEYLLNQIYQLKSLKYLKIPNYNYKTGKSTKIQKHFLEGVVIIEGSLLKYNRLWEYCDQTFYIKSPSWLRIIRTIRRDRKEKEYTYIKIIKKIHQISKIHEIYVKPLKKRNSVFKFSNNIFVKYPKLINDAHIRLNAQNCQRMTRQLNIIRSQADTRDKNEIYKLIARIIATLPKSEKEILNKCCLVSRGSLPRNEIRRTSDWDLSLIVCCDNNKNMKVYKKFFDLIKLVKPNSRNTGGIINLELYKNIFWDREEIILCGLLSSEYIFGDKNVYNKFLLETKNKIKNPICAQRVLFQYKIKRKIFHLADSKNSIGGIRDIHQLSWLSQLIYQWINLDTLAVIDNLYRINKITNIQKILLKYTYYLFLNAKAKLFIHPIRIINCFICNNVIRKISKDIIS